jgi:hypothetical protein
MGVIYAPVLPKQQQEFVHKMGDMFNRSQTSLNCPVRFSLPATGSF